MPQVVGAGVSPSQLEEVINALAKITRDRTYERIGQEVERLKEQGVL